MRLSSVVPFLRLLLKGKPKANQPVCWVQTKTHPESEVLSDPGKKREPVLGKTIFSGAATKKKGKKGATEQLRNPCSPVAVEEESPSCG